MAKPSELTLRTMILFAVLVILVALWAYSEVQAKAHEIGLRTITLDKVEEYEGPEYEVATTVEVSKEYGIFGETTGTVEVFLRAHGSGAIGNIQCRTFSYRVDGPLWVLMESAASNSPDVQIRGQKLFKARAVLI